jgi:hypothetical protein
METVLFPGAFFSRRPRSPAKKPGFPLQFRGFAYANPVGFPLQSLARPRGCGGCFTAAQRFCESKIAISFWRGPEALRREARRAGQRLDSDKNIRVIRKISGICRHARQTQGDTGEETARSLNKFVCLM